MSTIVIWLFKNSSNLINSHVNLPQPHFILFPELRLLSSIHFDPWPASWVKDKVEAGKGAELDKNNIDQFVMLLPAEDEIRKFRGRLEDYGLESFQDLEREASLSKG